MDREQQLLMCIDGEDDALYCMIASRDGIKVRESGEEFVVVQLFLDIESNL